MVLRNLEVVPRYLGKCATLSYLFITLKFESAFPESFIATNPTLYLHRAVRMASSGRNT
jgi:hypothetical protein